MLLSRCNTANQVYAVRLFVGKWQRSWVDGSVDKLLFHLGLAESTFYLGMQYIIGSWYRRDELAKGSCIFHISCAIATMFSGYLMVALYNLDGKGGMAGWKWYVGLLLKQAIHYGWSDLHAGCARWPFFPP